MIRSILITGAASGIGMASAVIFSKSGYQVFATYRKDKDGDELRKLNNVHPVKMDVTHAGDIQAALQYVSGVVGDDGLYAVMNNAGATYTAPFEFAKEARARQVIEVNVMAPYLITQAFLPLLKKFAAQNAVKPRVINIASWAGYMGQPFIPFYNASKAAIIGLSESMYYDLDLLGIHVVLASPGVTRTPFLEMAVNDGVLNLQDFPEEGYLFYKQYFDHYQKIGEQSRNSRLLPTPDKIAAKLFKIVASRKPGFKYNLAIDAIIVDKILTRFLPFRWRAAMNSRIFGLNKRKVTEQMQPA